MSTISRYVLVDREGNEDLHEYADYRDAEKVAARVGQAVVCRTYVYDDSELVYTPDGSDVWPHGDTKPDYAKA